MIRDFKYLQQRQALPAGVLSAAINNNYACTCYKDAAIGVGEVAGALLNLCYSDSVWEENID